MHRIAPVLIAIAAVACSDQTGPAPDESNQAPSFTVTSSPRYSGRAGAAQAIVSGFTTKLVEAGPLPSNGGTQSASLPSASVPGVLTASTLNASVDGRFRRSISSASTGTFKLTAGGNTISGTQVSSTAKAECYNRTSGSASVASLTINGAPVSVTSAPNQTFTLPNGKVVFNEQTRASGRITVVGLHVILTSGPDVQLSRAEAGLIC